MQRSEKRLDRDAVDAARVEYGASVAQQGNDRVLVAAAAGATASRTS
jgi:hypothetical protein